MSEFQPWGIFTLAFQRTRGMPTNDCIDIDMFLLLTTPVDKKCHKTSCVCVVVALTKIGILRQEQACHGSRARPRLVQHSQKLPSVEHLLVVSVSHFTLRMAI